MDIDTRPKVPFLPDQYRTSDQVVADQDQRDEVIAKNAPPQSIKRRRAARKPEYLTPRDTMWDIVGMDKSTDGPTDVSTNKHKYLAEAYLHERM